MAKQWNTRFDEPNVVGRRLKPVYCLHVWIGSGSGCDYLTVPVYSQSPQGADAEREDYLQRGYSAQVVWVG